MRWEMVMCRGSTFDGDFGNVCPALKVIRCDLEKGIVPENIGGYCGGVVGR